jgi:hypothetical protein|tara:strand:- start:2390 stop:3109 length:720 start_codon:yes stop_codon:yes gene_type:complete
MPYLPSDAEKKSELYNKIINADKFELSSKIENLKNQQNISGSIDANTPLRDDNGILVSFESEEAGVALEESFQDIRLQNAQRFYTKKVENEFTFFIPKSQTEETTDVEVNETEEVEDEVIDAKMILRGYLIQFIDEYYSEEFDLVNISTKLLHARLIQFFVENRKKGKNAKGWEVFRKNSKRKAAGISLKRLKKARKDLKNFTYDEVIENHIYRTPKGQEIWLKLGLPYVEDQSPGKDS